jgi:hypothetical protein
MKQGVYDLGSRRVNPSGSPMRPFAERKIDLFSALAGIARKQNRRVGLA